MHASDEQVVIGLFDWSPGRVELRRVDGCPREADDPESIVVDSVRTGGIAQFLADGLDRHTAVELPSTSGLKTSSER